MKTLIEIAAAELGIKEIAGNENNVQIVNYAQESGFKNVEDDETPWCSIFVNWCCMKAGLQRTYKTNARSWLSVGFPVEDPRPGDIVIYWRENPNSWKGHVGIFMGYSKDRSLVFTLGGNQKNCVSIQGYDATNVLGFRRLSSEVNIEIPKSNPNLKIGSQGSEVIKLQKILTELGFDCGAADGIFGPKTEARLKSFQKKEGHSDDGIYSATTKALIVSIYQQ